MALFRMLKDLLVTSPEPTGVTFTHRLDVTNLHPFQSKAYVIELIKQGYVVKLVETKHKQLVYWGKESWSA